eukprot:COSAG02_NODE_68811_length_219_cov_157.800000_1_plen_24_part_10
MYGSTVSFENISDSDSDSDSIPGG